MEKLFQNKAMLVNVVFAISIIYSIIYSFFGIDMRDACLHFYIQRNSFQGSGDIWTSVPLTNFIGGWWLSISPISNRILWANFGGALLYTISMVFAIKIYLEIFEQIDWKDWIAIICIVLLIQNKDTISYYHFPITLCNVFFYFWIRCVKNRNYLKNYFIMGCVGAVILFSRFTFITILFFPIVLELYKLLYRKEKIKKQLLVYIIGISLSLFILFPLFLMWKSQFNTGNSELTMANILYRAKSFMFIIFPIINILTVSCSVILVIGLIERYLSVRQQKKMGVFVLIFSFLVSLLFLLLFSIREKEWWTAFGPLPNEKIFLIGIPGLLMILFFIALFDHDLTGIKLNSEQERPYIIAICLFSLIVPIGSDVGFCKLGYMAPIGLMILGGCILHRTIKTYLFRIYAYYAFLLTGVIVRPLYSYLDAPIFQCNTSPEFSGLKHIYTTEQRAQDWDKLLSILQREAKNEKEVLMVGYLNFGPLFLLDLHDWNHGVCTGGKDFMKRYYVYSKQKNLPQIAFVDENSDEFKSFKGILQDNYQPIFCLKRQHFCYSIWRKR